ncbi:hypothetical protein EVAR_98650_1 [Eumeta japonica]|uniref:Regulatory protein zeste n=1 Tax=Eumeta variegata TaxID=151549 RepID=A0A4C1XUE1_EUMVA|nr:hypothetical protein EVAR_98650_1 [Eumeta japonica]
MCGAQIYKFKLWWIACPPTPLLQEAILLALSAKKNDMEWANLKAVLAERGPDKSVEQWKNTWRDLKKRARSEMATHKRSQNITGNKEPVPVISDITNKITDIIGLASAIGIGPWSLLLIHSSLFANGAAFFWALINDEPCSSKLGTDTNTGCEKNDKETPSEELLKKKIRLFDACNLPPSTRELLEHVKRTIYLSNVWRNAHKQTPTEKKPEECGWNLIEEKYEFHWFDGPHSPQMQEINIARAVVRRVTRGAARAFGNGWTLWLPRWSKLQMFLKERGHFDLLREFEAYCASPASLTLR